MKKNVTLDPRLGTLALDMEPSTLDPRQKDRLEKYAMPCIWHIFNKHLKTKLGSLHEP